MLWLNSPPFPVGSAHLINVELDEVNDVVEVNVLDEDMDY